MDPLLAPLIPIIKGGGGWWGGGDPFPILKWAEEENNIFYSVLMKPIKTIWTTTNKYQICCMAS